MLLQVAEGISGRRLQEAIREPMGDHSRPKLFWHQLC